MNKEKELYQNLEKRFQEYKNKDESELTAIDRKVITAQDFKLMCDRVCSAVATV
jgi:hypothetical protein